MLTVPLSGVAVAKIDLPDASEPGCVGKVIAACNHNSGVNPDANDAKGSGYCFARDRLLADSVKEALAMAREWCEVDD